MSSLIHYLYYNLDGLNGVFGEAGGVKKVAFLGYWLLAGVSFLLSPNPEALEG